MTRNTPTFVDRIRAAIGVRPDRHATIPEEVSTPTAPTPVTAPGESFAARLRAAVRV